jgi:RHS repeat-associated protein
MMGRYNGDGSLLEETVWLGDLPVAVLAPGAQYFVAPDHLGAPHQITDSGGNVVWLWDHDPFGNGTPTGTFGYNLRFPGQFYDTQTGLHYNYYRDYDPAKGRYLESDPGGLAGGTNTYAYVSNRPADTVDPSGRIGVYINFGAGAFRGWGLDAGGTSVGAGAVLTYDTSGTNGFQLHTVTSVNPVDVAVGGGLGAGVSFGITNADTAADFVSIGSQGSLGLPVIGVEAGTGGNNGASNLGLNFGKSLGIGFQLGPSNTTDLTPNGLISSLIDQFPVPQTDANGLVDLGGGLKVPACLLF